MTDLVTNLRRVDFDLRLQISPYAVYRRLAAGEPLMLVDLRLPPGARPACLAAAMTPPGADWLPPGNIDVVFFDRDGSVALERVRGLRRQGHHRVWALFGGLELWDLALGE